MIEYEKMFLIFMLYSIVGWVVEVIATYPKEKKFVNRGFLIGPYCPIYGFGFIGIVLLLKKYMDHPIALFFLIMVLCTFIEYITSLIMEKMFKVRFWDYSHKILNIDGRVCLINSFYFGVLGIIGLYYINPHIETFINSFSDNLIYFLTLFFAIMITLDFILSFKVLYKIKNKIKFINKDNTSEIKTKINEIMNNNIFTRRIKNAFPNYNPIKTLKKIQKKIASKL